MLLRTIGLCVMLVAALAAGIYLYNHQDPVCRICLRPMHRVTSFFARLESGELVETCCPRCGLHFVRGRQDVESLEVSDFASGRVIAAQSAVYVEGGSIHLCCSVEPIAKDKEGSQYELTWDRCLPSVVAFEDRSAAEAFVRENGGVIKSYGALAPDSQGDL